LEDDEKEEKRQNQSQTTQLLKDEDDLLETPIPNIQSRPVAHLSGDTNDDTDVDTGGDENNGTVIDETGGDENNEPVIDETEYYSDTTTDEDAEEDAI
jgi:hypothetical protein